jgi:hypothetical protein
MSRLDYQLTVGKQRVLWAKPGGKLIANGEEVDIGAILIESGTAVLGEWFMLEEILKNWEVRIPIFRVPPGGFVLKAVATCHLAAISWNDASENSVWAVAEVHTEVDIGSQEFFVVPHMGYMGEGGGTIMRVSYHVTVFLGGVDTFHRADVIRELERG